MVFVIPGLTGNPEIFSPQRRKGHQEILLLFCHSRAGGNPGPTWTRIFTDFFKTYFIAFVIARLHRRPTNEAIQGFFPHTKAQRHRDPEIILLFAFCFCFFSTPPGKPKETSS